MIKVLITIIGLVIFVLVYCKLFFQEEELEKKHGKRK